MTLVSNSADRVSKGKIGPVQKRKEIDETVCIISYPNKANGIITTLKSKGILVMTLCGREAAHVPRR